MKRRCCRVSSEGPPKPRGSLLFLRFAAVQPKVSEPAHHILLDRTPGEHGSGSVDVYARCTIPGR